jgi:hypothetical protein
MTINRKTANRIFSVTGTPLVTAPEQQCKAATSIFDFKKKAGDKIEKPVNEE